ncbi:uncharacterized protein LOC126655062 [Mercurialis annua]|uniref:uncharacterized protein LOC126655062 n=1 Tax=Mercurialis annua TaxID=3986 RepID=UPI00215E868B|nr:uncharacterized protein LOC126655062 [Mercurialis annua]
MRENLHSIFSAAFGGRTSSTARTAARGFAGRSTAFRRLRRRVGGMFSLLCNSCASFGGFGWPKSRKTEAALGDNATPVTVGQGVESWIGNNKNSAKKCVMQ